MKTKISMKTIYLILVITIGLVGLGIGSTLAVFTASAEISNPISFSSNLSYDGEVFDTVEVTIGPNSSRDVNFAIFNTAMLPNINYVIWYIYEGNSSDLNFTTNNESSPSGVVSYREGDPQQGEELYFNVTNNTSNTITITMGVATSQSDIVLPSYMKPVTISAPSTYNLTLIKGTGVSIIYYKVNGASSYTSTTTNKTLSVNSGTTYYYYGVPQTGYTMNSCTSSSPCSGTMGTSAVTKSLTASANSYNLTLSKGTGVGVIYYRVNGATNYSSSTTSKTVAVKYGTTYYYYGTASTGYTMGSCTLSSPCSGTMGASAVTKSLTATANSYNLTLNIGTGVNEIYYKINGASSYTSSTSNKTLSVKYGTTYYYYGTALTGYKMNSCTSASPCSGTMGTSAVTKTLTASQLTSYTVTIKKSIDGAAATTVKTITVYSGDTGSAVITGGAWYTFDSVSCTNGQSATITESYSGTSQVNGDFTIRNVTSNTVCTVYISS